MAEYPRKPRSHLINSSNRNCVEIRWKSFFHPRFFPKRNFQLVLNFSTIFLWMMKMFVTKHMSCGKNGTWSGKVCGIHFTDRDVLSKQNLAFYQMINSLKPHTLQVLSQKFLAWCSEQELVSMISKNILRKRMKVNYRVPSGQHYITW